MEIHLLLKFLGTIFLLVSLCIYHFKPKAVDFFLGVSVAFNIASLLVRFY